MGCFWRWWGGWTACVGGVAWVAGEGVEVGGGHDGGGFRMLEWGIGLEGVLVG